MVALGGLGYQLFTSRCGGVPLGLPSAGPLSEVTAPTPLTQVQEAFHQCWKQVASFPLFYFYLDLPFLSLLSLPCSVLVPNPTAFEGKPYPEMQLWLVGWF